MPIYPLPLWTFTVVGSVDLANEQSRRTCNAIGYRWEPDPLPDSLYDFAGWPGLLLPPWLECLDLLPNGWVLDHVELNQPSAANPAWDYSFAGRRGLAPGGYTPPNVAVHVNLWSSFRGRMARGSKRFGPVPLEQIDGNQLSLAGLADWQGAAEKLIQPIFWRTVGTTDFYLQPVIWQRVQVPGQAVEHPSGLMFDMAHTSICPILSTVRRRRSLAKS